MSNIPIPTEENKDKREEWVLDTDLEDSELVKDRGFSILDIRIRINPSRPINVQHDVDFRFDGGALLGLCGLEFSSVPPYVAINILDTLKFQESINKAGFFFQQGILVRQVLYNQTYPAVLCGLCIDAGREGYLSIQHGSMCSNPDCPNASNLAKSQALMQKHLPGQGKEGPTDEEIDNESEE